MQEKYLQYVLYELGTRLIQSFLLLHIYTYLTYHPNDATVGLTIIIIIIIENILFFHLSNYNHFNFEPVSYVIMINNIIIYMYVIEKGAKIIINIP